MTNIRVFVDQPIIRRSFITLNEEQSHYLVNVMRRKVGDFFYIFDGVTGEWLAALVQIDKNSAVIAVDYLVKPITDTPRLSLIFAPLKSTRLPYLVEKATEIGVTDLYPINTKNSITDKINNERIISTMIQASAQSRRLTVPNIHHISNLKDLLQSWPLERKIAFCNERESNTFIAELKDGVPDALLIGPEGGFTTDEIQLIMSYPFIKSVSISTNILRAETAGVVGLTMLQCMQRSG
jgi:16S rRNA (uracil1498-N3)-methyltransferase